MRITNLFFPLVIVSVVMMLFSSCKDASKELPDVVAPEPTSETANTSTNAVVANVVKKNNITVWIEGNANFERLNSADKMNTVLAKVKAMGATGVIVEVKGMTGLVQYNSSIAGHLKESNGMTQHIRLGKSLFDFSFVVPKLVNRLIPFLQSYQGKLHLPSGKVPKLRNDLPTARDQRPLAIGRNCCGRGVWL